MQVSFQYRLKFNEVYDLYSTLGAKYESKLEPLSAQGWGMLGSPEFTQRVHVGIWYILGVQRGSHVPTLRPKYVLYSYMDPLG